MYTFRVAKDTAQTAINMRRDLRSVGIPEIVVFEAQYIIDTFVAAGLIVGVDVTTYTNLGVLVKITSADGEEVSYNIRDGVGGVSVNVVSSTEVFSHE